MVSEFDDSALMNAFSHADIGMFPEPTVIETEILTQYEVVAISHVPDVVQQYHAISVERKLTHPNVLRIAERARHDLFQDAARTPTAKSNSR